MNTDKRPLSGTKSGGKTRRSGLPMIATVLFSAQSTLLWGVRPAAAQHGVKHGTGIALTGSALPHGRFTPGEGVVYDLHYAAQGHVDLHAPGQSGGVSYDVDMAISGRWAVRALNRSADQVRLSCRLDSPLVTCRISGKPAAAQQIASLERDLARNTYVISSLQGHVRRIAFDSATLPASRNTIKALLAMSQFVLPASRSASRRWQAQEETPNGIYQAAYEAEQKRGASPLIVKRFDQGKAVSSVRADPSMSTVRSAIPRSLTRAQFDAQTGVLSALQGAQLEVQTLQNKQIGSAKSSLRLRLLEKRAISSAQIRLAATEADKYTWTTLARREANPQAEVSYNQRVLGNATLSSLLGELEHTEADGSDQGALYPRLRALILVYPKSCIELEQHLSKCRSDSRTFSLITSAIGSAGHAQAQAALSAVLQTRQNDVPALIRLISLLGMAHRPTAATEQTLQQYAAHASPAVASTARLALGVVAHDLRGEFPARAERIVRWLEQQLTTAGSPSEQELWLRALGNAGLERTLPLLRSFLNSGDASVRAAAVAALRWLDTPETAERLQNILTHDRDVEVRRQAAFALGFLPFNMEAYRLQQRILAVDEDTPLRIRILDNLWKERDRFPDAHRLVEQAAALNTSEQVRKAARSYLVEQ